VGARTLRALAIRRTIDPHLYLVVQSSALAHVFDDVDAAFIHSCAFIMCNMQQAAELQRTAAARARFLRGMSHELRTPIHALLSTCELLADHARAAGAAHMTEPLGVTDGCAHRGEHAALLATAMASGRSLLSTVNNLLNYDSLEGFAAAPALVAIAGVEQAVLDAAAATIVDRGVPVRLVAECALPPGVHLVHTDHDLLRQCLGALVGNAVRYTHAGSVTLRTTLDAPADGGPPALVYDVLDTGPGVPPAEAARIFLPFEKADAHAPGIGLGLTVAAHVARALGGNVSIVASSPNGTHFRLRLARPTLASQRGHASRRVTRSALPRTFHVASGAPPLLADAAVALRAAGLTDAGPEDAALVLLSAPAGALDAALAGVAPRQLALVLHGAEDDALAARHAAGAGARVVHMAAPLYQARLWPALVQAADAFDAIGLATLWAPPSTALEPEPISLRAAPELEPAPAPARPPLVPRVRSVLQVLIVDDNVRRTTARACTVLMFLAENEPRHPAPVRPPAWARPRVCRRRRAGCRSLPRNRGGPASDLARPGPFPGARARARR
jgi:signal transduction histidine kinase